MGKLFFFAILIFIFLSQLSHAQISDEKVTSSSSISATVNNLGLLGNAYRGSYTALGYPSLTFPAGSGIEHLVQGGLWVGAFKQGAPLVTTGALLLSGNGSSNGYIAGVPGFEFTAPVGSKIAVRSSLSRSPAYNPSAVSHQDFITTFTDKNISIPEFNEATYKPEGKISKLTFRLQKLINDYSAVIKFKGIQSSQLWKNLKIYHVILRKIN
jgi:hypothetical protein